MSLFGGEAPPPPAEDSESTPPSATSLPPSIDDPATRAQPWNAGSSLRDTSPSNPAFGAATAANTDPNAKSSSAYSPSALEEEEEEEEWEKEEEDDRPNKHHGPARTWRHWTAPERQIVACLDRLQAEDLSLHLCNAHALKARLRPKARRHRSAGEVGAWRGKEDGVEDRRGKDGKEGRKGWAPPALWTAWPLPPELVPRPEERFGGPPDDGLEEWTVGGGVKESDEELREILVGLVQKEAKERWWERGWAKEDEGARLRRKSRSRSGSRVKLEEGGSGRDRRGSSTGRSSSETSETASGEPDATDDGNEDLHDGLAGQDGAEDVEQRLLIPTVLADDDEASRILEPTIATLMEKLNTLLDGLRQSRNAHIHRDTDDEKSSRSLSRSRSRSKFRQTSTTHNGREHQTAVQAQPQKRKRGRPRKPIHQVSVSRSVEDVQSYQSPPRKDRRGRPRKWPNPLPGETHYMMRRRVTAAEGPQTNDPPPRSDSSDEDEDELSSTTTRRSASATTQASSRRGSRSSSQSKRKPALRDWSEVLGVAALVGWDADVVARAAERCARLFGEGMGFRRLDVDAALAEQRAGTVEVVTQAGRASGINETVETRGEADGEEDEDADAEEPQRRPYLHPLSLRCPHEDCKWHSKDFPFRFRLTEHIIRKHGYDPRREQDRNGEDMLVGGVHNDGFLELVPSNAGPRKRGKDKQKSVKRAAEAERRKRRRVEEKDREKDYAKSERVDDGGG